MTIGELKEKLNKYQDDMEVLIQGALFDGSPVEEVNYDCGRNPETGKIGRAHV